MGQDLDWCVIDRRHILLARICRRSYGFAFWGNKIKMFALLGTKMFALLGKQMLALLGIVKVIALLDVHGLGQVALLALARWGKSRF